MKHPTKHSKDYLSRRYHHQLKQLRISGMSMYEALKHMDYILNTAHRGKIK